ncbi:ABC transporter substrate-binding protein [Paenibacillus chungangensis]|uniref:ABC transporter substrate-binding protein n=1 Tax=Paenibacillus chungangensis TaxID=696535 RepID=A0ABW3HP83_9BACL
MKGKGLLKLMLVVLFVVQLVLAGCSSENERSDGKGANTEKDKGASGDSTEQVTLNLFSAHGQFNKGNFGYEEVQAFMKENPDIKVEVTAANGQHWVDTFQALAATGDLPDVFMPTIFTFSELLQNNWVQPLDGLVSADFVDRFPEGTFLQGTNMHEGKIYSFPRIVAKKGRVLVYNKDIMKDAGLDPEKPPTTWDELYEMSKQIKEKTGLAGMVIPLKDSVGYEDMAVMGTPYHPTLHSDRGFDLKEGRYAFDSPAITKPFEFVAKMNSEGLLHANSFTLGLIDAQGIFANKQAAFMLNQHWIVRVLELELGQVQDFGVAQLPAPEAGMNFTQLGSSADHNAYISTSTKHPEAAAKLIEWLTSKEYYTRQMQQDYLLAPMMDLYEDASNFPKPELKQMADAFMATVVERPVPESRDGVTEVRKLEAAIAKPNPQWWETLQKALLQNTDPGPELAAYTKAMNERLDQAIQEAKDQGIAVEMKDFAFPAFDGKSDFINN